MKRSLFTKRIKQSLLAVPAAALMLGAAQAGSTVGLNIQSWYYDSGTTPQTVGYGAGYQTTGFPATAKAFGVGAANWVNTDPLDCSSAVSTSVAMGAITANLTAANPWESDIGNLIIGSEWAGPATVTPGNDEVTWSFLDNTGWSVDLSGLNTAFPNGYVIQCIGASKATANSLITFSDPAAGALGFNPINTAGNAKYNGPVGLQVPTPTLTGDTLTMSSPSRPASANCALAGFIITDQPVVTRDVPTSMLLASGAALVLPTPTTIIGIGLTYQWQHAGTNLPGATFSSYTNSSLVPTDAGLYSAVVTSTFFPSQSVTGQVASVNVVPAHAARSATFDGNTGVTGAQDGSGTWGFTLLNWWSGSADDYWGNPDSAIFGAGGTGAYSVALTANVSANAITFNSGAYTITNTAGEILTLAGTGAITATTNGTIACPLSTGTNGLTKVGVGKLTLAGAFDATNNVLVKTGTLEVQTKTGGDAPYIVTNGATLRIGYSTGGGYANTGLKIYGDGTAATSGLYLKGGTTYNVAGTPTLLGAPTTVHQYGTGMASLGIFDVNGTGLLCSSAASGSIIDSNVQMVRITYGMAAQVDVGANTTTGDLILNGPLNVGPYTDGSIYGFIKRGTGSLRLNAVATTTNSALDVRAGSAICGVNDCIGLNAILKSAASATIDLKGTTQNVSSATLLGTLKMTINKGGSPNCNQLIGTVTFGGTLVVTNTGGTLALGDTFTLFPGSSGGGAFTSLVLPTLSNGLAWQDNSAVDGTISVIVGSIAPSFVTDLSGVTNFAYVGTLPTFSVVAAGDPTLRYQWVKNGVTPVGTDSATITLPAITLASDADYSVTVTNNFGAVSSLTNHLTVISPALFAAQIVADAPLAYLPLSETDAPTAYDYSGHANNGTQQGGLTLGVDGPRTPAFQGFTGSTTAYQFDGGSASIDCGTAPAISGTSDFTVEAWVNTTTTTFSRLIQQRSGFDGEYMFDLNADGTLHFTVYGGGYQFDFNSPGTKLVNDGSWHHIVAERSGTNGFIFIDGSLMAQASGPVRPLNDTFTVGVGKDFRDDSSYFDGALCNVAIYSHALSAARVGAHAVTGILGTTPLAITIAPGGATITWPLGILESATTLSPSNWTPVTGATSPYSWLSTTNASRFYRVKL